MGPNLTKDKWTPQNSSTAQIVAYFSKKVEALSTIFFYPLDYLVNCEYKMPFMSIENPSTVDKLLVKNAKLAFSEDIIRAPTELGNKNELQKIIFLLCISSCKRNTRGILYHLLHISP